MRRFTFLLLLTLISCEDQQSIKVIGMENLLHDDSSKVWMIMEDQSNGEEFAPENNNFKTILIFYKSGKFAEQPLNTVGNRPPIYGTYQVHGENENIQFTVSNRENVFDVVSYSKEKIELKSDQTKLVLIPMPEL